MLGGLAPDALAGVYDSLNGTDLARLRAVSRGDRNAVNGLTGENAASRDEKLRADRRRRREYRQALDAGLEYVKMNSMSSMKIVCDDYRIFEISGGFTPGQLYLSRHGQNPVRVSEKFVREVDPDHVVFIQLTSLEGFRRAQQTIYPVVRAGAFPVPEDYYKFHRSELTASGGIIRFRHENDNSDDVVFFDDDHLMPHI